MDGSAMNRTKQIEGKDMAKRKSIDQDVLVLKKCVNALEQSSSHRMLIANLSFLWDRYVLHPTKESLPKHLRR